MKDAPATPTVIPGRLSGLGDDIRAALILIVDDMAIMRKMIAMCLERAGFTNLIEAEDGDIALDLINEKSPDIVILDINMPRVSGYEVCKALRQNAATQDLPILVQSAAETPEERTEVFTLGATDFVSKPINQPELLARVCMHLENRLLIQSLEKYATRVGQELEIAREMQQALLPTPEQLETLSLSGMLDVDARYEASSELGGDLWGGWSVDQHHIGFYVLDVAGHGVAAALNTFRIHAAMNRRISESGEPARFLSNLNRDLCDVMQTGQFATMLYGVLDVRTGHLRYAAAGAPAPLISNGSDMRQLESSGLPVGISKDAEYDERSDTLKLDETMLLYSDVMIETFDHAGKMLGVESLATWFLEDLNAEDNLSVVGNLYDRLRLLIDGPMPDDLTLVSVRLSGKAASDE